MNFDYCPNVTKLPVPLTRELFEKLIREPWLEQMAADIAAGNLNRKRDLPAVCWQAAYGGQKRSNANAVSSGLFALDIDHVENPEALYQSFRERIPELGIYIVHKTPSTKGLRIVASCRQEFSTIGENQAWMAAQLGVEHDAVTRDFARLSFLVPVGYFYHYDAAVFSDEPAVVLQGTGLQPAQGGVPSNPSAGKIGCADFPHGYSDTAFQAGQCDAASSQNSQAASDSQSVSDAAGSRYSEAASGSQNVSDAAGSRYSEAVSNPVRSAGCTNTPNQTCLEGSTSSIPQTDLEFRGIKYSEIVEELVARTGGEPYEGERNNRLYLICRLLANITDRQVERLFQVCPRFGLSEAEVRACCESACKSARTEKLPYVLYKVLRDFGIDPNNPNSVRNDNDNDDDNEEALRTDANDSRVCNLPEARHLPPLIREFVETAPDDFREATAMACLPICGFLGSRLRARYSDGEIQAPSFIVNIIAPAASGKGSLLRIADICLERVRAKDEEGRAAEAEYNRQSKLKKNDKKQLEEPQPIVRDIPAKVSVAQLLKRMVQAQGLHLISISSEADTLSNSNKAGAWAQKSDIYRVAQDADGGRYGQDYKSDVSFSATCKMRYNLLTLGTPGAIARAYPDVEDGLISRCIMVELPSQFGKAMPVRKQLTARQERTIREKVDALMAICQDEQGGVLPEYHLSLGWLREGIDQWVREQRMRAVRDDDHARDQFMRRAAMFGFRAGMVASFLWGRTNRERKGYTLEFSLWVCNYILGSLLSRYSDKVNEQARSYEAPKAKRYPSLFEAMNDVFTVQDLRKACTAQGMKSPIKSIIFRWSDNALIEKQGDHFIKLTK